jgi:hypothetical protein
MHSPSLTKQRSKLATSAGIRYRPVARSLKMMKTYGNGSGAAGGAAATTTVLLAALLVLVVASSMRADAAAAPRRLGEPGPNPCTNDPNNPGHGCHV